MVTTKTINNQGSLAKSSTLQGDYIQGGPKNQLEMGGCNSYKWPYKWVTGVITLRRGVITPFITGRGPPYINFHLPLAYWVEGRSKVFWDYHPGVPKEKIFQNFTQKTLGPYFPLGFSSTIDFTKFNFPWTRSI